METLAGRQRAALEVLPEDLKAIVAAACATENIRALGESEWQNAARLKVLVDEKGVQIRDFPEDIVKGARKSTVQTLDALAETDAITQEAVESFRAASRHLDEWSKLSVRNFLAARG